MFTREGHHLGDIWTCVRGEELHLFFLNCPISVERHTRWSIGHATTTDLINWKDHGDLFHSVPEDPRRCCLSTGSVTRYGDCYVMGFLANHNTPNPRVIYAQSEDLMAWRELTGSGCDLHSSPYGRRGSLHFKNPRWRDPFLFECEGWLHQLMTASDDSLPPEADGVVAHMRTRNLSDWEFLPALDLTGLGTDLECPKLYQVEDRWFLLVSMFSLLQSTWFKSLQPPHLNGNTTYVFSAENQQGPYTFTGPGRMLNRDYPGGPYACDAFCFQGQWYLMGTCWSDRLGDRISDAIPVSFHSAENSC